MKLSSTAFILLGSYQGFKQAVVTAIRSPSHASTVEFELFGPGYCADSRFRLFYSILLADLENLTSNDCSRWCLQNRDNLLGFSYSSSEKECYCELNGGLILGIPPAYSDPPATRYESGLGTGSIQQTTLNSGGTAFDCYVYPDFAPPPTTQTPTNFPTYWPTDFPTYFPTYWPTFTPVDTLTGVDIGSVGVAGSSIVIDNEIEVKGAGSDIWGSRDSFHFLHKTSSEEDVSIEMFVEDLTGSDLYRWAKGGLMFRDSLDSASRHFSLFVTGNNGLANQWRSVSYQQSLSHHSTNAASRNVWLKITKRGNTFQAYYKTDNNDSWSTFGSEKTVSFSGTFYYGIAVTSHDNTKIAKLTGSKFASVAPTSTSPSKSPIRSPSFSLSSQPTSSPTSSPLHSPSISPSSQPTPSPSSLPSRSPSISSSSYPTSFPSSSSLQSPSKRPSSGLSIPTSIAPTSPTRPSTTDNCYKSARKVRLESTTGRQLQMFELRAFSSSINVALNKNATQSSTLSTLRDTFAASNAVDGNSLTFSHTKDANAYFEVDLGDTFDLESVEIVNRWCHNETDPNRCLCRLSYANLKLLDENDSIVASRMLGNTCNDGVVLESFATCGDSPPFY